MAAAGLRRDAARLRHEASHPSSLCDRACWRWSRCELVLPLRGTDTWIDFIYLAGGLLPLTQTTEPAQFGGCSVANMHRRRAFHRSNRRTLAHQQLDLALEAQHTRHRGARPDDHARRCAAADRNAQLETSPNDSPITLRLCTRMPPSMTRVRADVDVAVGRGNGPPTRAASILIVPVSFEGLPATSDRRSSTISPLPVSTLPATRASRCR